MFALAAAALGARGGDAPLQAHGRSLGTISAAEAILRQQGLPCRALEGQPGRGCGDAATELTILLLAEGSATDELTVVAGAANVDEPRTEAFGNAMVAFVTLLEELAPGSGIHLVARLTDRESVHETVDFGPGSLTVDYRAATGSLLASLRPSGSSGIPEPSEPPAPLPSELTGVIEAATADIGRFWSRTLPPAAGSTTYRAPAGPLLAYRRGEIPAVECAHDTEVDQWVDNAFYCRIDETIAYDADFLGAQWQAHGDFAPTAILAHEFGHHAQVLLGRPRDRLPRELQADCFAGMYFADRFRSAIDRDLAEAGRAFYFAGDARSDSSGWFDVRHGSPAMRLMAMDTGLVSDGDTALCQGYAAFVAGAIVNVGPFWFVDVPGLDGRRDGDGWVLTARHGVARLVFLETGIVEPSAEELLLAGWEAVWGDSIRATHGPIRIAEGPWDRPLRGTWAGYEVVDDSGIIEEHGVMAVVLPRSGTGALLIRIRAEGPPPELTGASRLERQFSLAFLLLGRICRPGDRGDIGDPTYSFACRSDL